MPPEQTWPPLVGRQGLLASQSPLGCGVLTLCLLVSYPPELGTSRLGP